MPPIPPRRWFQYKLSTWFVMVAILPLIGSVLMSAWAIINPPEWRPRSNCKNNLKFIGLALLAYESTYGTYPPAYIADADGQPMHSWRVLLLPFLEEDELYARYDFDEPWNGPHNSKLAVQMPKYFRCPKSTNPIAGQTNYAASVGVGSAFDGNTALKFDDVKDGLSNTIAVIEVPDNCAICWLSPHDSAIKTLASNHLNGANVVYIDSSVSYLDLSIAPKVIEALQTIAGGEDATEREVERR